MKKLFKCLCVILLALLGLTVLLSLLLTGTLYYANAHGQLQPWLNERLGAVQVSYQKAEVSWHHFDPTLSLEGVVISDRSELASSIHFDSISVSFGIWHSILRANLVTDNITLKGLSLRILQNKDGSFDLLGLHQKSTAPFEPSPLLTKWFLAQTQIHLENIVADVSLHNGQHLTFNIDDLNWQQDSQYHFNLLAHISEIPNSQMKLNASLYPGLNPLDLEAWHIVFQGVFKGDDFTPLFANQRFYNFSWVAGGGDLNFKGNIANGGMQDFKMEVDLKNLNLAHVSSSNILASRFDELIEWQALPKEAWKLNLKLMGEDDGVPSQLQIFYTPNSKMVWNMQGEDIPFSLIGEWVAFWFPANSYTIKAWQSLKPSGAIQTLTLADGPSGGSIQNTTLDFTIGSNPIFPSGWPKSVIKLGMRWSKPPGKVNFANVSLQQLSLSNPWINLNLRGSLNIPQKNRLYPKVDLQGTLTGKNLGQVKLFYIPHEIVPEALSQWLTQGLLVLPKVTGTFTLQGNLAQFPFEKGNGLFQIALHVSNTSILPWTGWPAIKEVTGEVLFKNQKLTIDADQASTTGVPLHHVHFEIADLRPHFIKEIVIQGDAVPTGAAGLNYLADMPIIHNPRLTDWLRSQNLSGSLPLHLEITIPLHEPNEGVVAVGDVRFQNNNWAFSQNEAPFLSNLNGHLHFENAEISSDDLSFEALNQPLYATIPQSSLDHLKVFFAHFNFLGQDFPELEMDIDSSGSQTILNFTHPLLKGNLYLTHNAKEIVAHFSEFHLPLINRAQSIENGETGAGSTPVLLGSLFSHVPALNITVDQLDYGVSKLGQFFWESVPTPTGVQINHMNLTSPDISLNLAGQIETLAGLDHFSVAGMLGSQNFGNFVTDLNYPNVMSEGRGQIDFNLNLAGSLAKPNLQTLNGTLDFDLNNGKFLKINAGLARIFGLVSLDTIFSTLSFNFQNMMSEGLAFDSLSGGYKIKNGVATTGGKGVVMMGPSVNVTLTGQMDLALQTLKQKATVMPQVGNSIAIAAAIVATPIAGIATWFADKILANTLLKSAGITYHVTGTFDKPVVALFTPEHS